MQLALFTKGLYIIAFNDNIIVFGDNNMLTACEQKIMGVLLPQPFKRYSIRQLSIQTKQSYALVHESVKALLNKKMILVERLGNALACQLNCSADPQLLAIASLGYSQKFLQKAKFGFVIDEIKQKLQDVHLLV